MKLFRFRKILAGLAAASMVASVSASVGALNDFSFSALASSGSLAQGCFENYKRQFGDDATKTSAFEIVKQYQDRIDELILMFENHEQRLCVMEKSSITPRQICRFFQKEDMPTPRTAAN